MSKSRSKIKIGETLLVFFLLFQMGNWSEASALVVVLVVVVVIVNSSVTDEPRTCT